jgi:hypothetical protein
MFFKKIKLAVLEGSRYFTFTITISASETPVMSDHRGRFAVCGL